MIVYLSLGSNLGERHANLQAAIAALPPEVEVRRVSSIYETEPWGFTDQPAFLNQVLEGESDLSPLALMAHLKQIEARLGRIPGFRYGPRLIDLDILFYGAVILDQPGLTIPHPRLAERAFVLVPLAELAPGLMEPVSGKTIQELVKKVDRSGVKKV